MKREHIKKEITASKETIEKLEEIKVNTEKGIEVNKFVLEKLEEELKCTST